MSRNPLGARRPTPTGPPPPPRILPDGSESLQHGGSVGAYMALKARKLGEQFDERAAALPGQQRTHIFRGVAIHVDGFTRPSNLELKQLMTLHGGQFILYPSRATPATHVICSNLPDAKVKLLQKERNPTPYVRPEWVVDCLAAGRLLPIEDYVLWQLRDVPGQQKLKAFMPVQPVQLPPSCIFGDQAGALSSPMRQAGAAGSAVGQAGAARPADPAAVHPAGVATDAPSPCAPASADAGQVAAQSASQQNVLPQPPQFSFAPAHELEGQPPSPSLMPSQLGRKQAQQLRQPALANPALLAAPLEPAPCPPQQAEAAQGAAGPHAPPVAAAGVNQAGAAPGVNQAGAAPGVNQAGAAAGVNQAGTAPGGTAAATLAGASGGTAMATATLGVGQYDAAEMQAAQQVAARMRAECDMLKGPPRSSREDPEFVDNFFNASRLHYIGTYKSRIEALMASSAGSQGPSPLPPSRERPAAIIHLDMDCFFAAVAEAEHPIFKGKPLAVCHSASSSGTGEVSTCNYEARKYSVQSGMMIRQAIELCPQLIVVPYLFEQYATVSEKVYRILLRRTVCVQPLSCDEALLDVTGLGDPMQMAAEIRAEIEAATGCTASAGIGPSQLVARIATEGAKPNGQMLVTQQQAPEFLRALPVSKLPGVGYRNEARLADLGIHSVADVQASTKQHLQAHLGEKLGAMLWDYAHGQDKRRVQPPGARKSVGAECNYGVRFQSVEESREFLNDLAAQVQVRLREAAAKGRTLTLKLMKRKQGAGEPRKFMGHGVCDSLSRSATLASFTDSSKEIAARCWELLCALHVPFADIRGMGILVSRLTPSTAPIDARPSGAARAHTSPGSKAKHNIAELFQKQIRQQDEQQQQQPQQQQDRAQRLGKQQQQQQQDRQRQQKQQQDRGQQHPGQGQLEEEQQGLGSQQQSPVAASRCLDGGSQECPGRPPQACLGVVVQQQPAEGSVADAAGGVGGGAAHGGAQGRQQALQQWHGIPLSQMDASVLRALPWSVQKQLVEAASREDAAGPAGQHLQRRALEGGRFEESVAAAAAAGLEAGPAAAVAADCHEAAAVEGVKQGGRLGSAAVPAVQRQQQSSSTFGSGGGWDSGTQARADQDGSAPPRGTSQSMPAVRQPPQHLQMHGGGGTAALLLASTGERGGSVSGAAPSEQPGTTAGGTGAVALPALSQVDPAFMDALPLQLRRELELAYGIGRHGKRPPVPAARRGRGGAAPASVAGAGSLLRHVSKRQRIEAFVAPPPPTTDAASSSFAAAAAAKPARRQEQEQGVLSLSQIDPSVLAELPAELRQEVMQQLRQEAGAPIQQGGRKHQRSRLGQRNEEQHAWQQRWEEERQQQQQDGKVLATGAVAAARSAVEQMPQQQLQLADGQEPNQELPAATLQFLQSAYEFEAGHGTSSSLAAALADCLEQLQAELAGKKCSRLSSPPCQIPRSSPAARSADASSARASSLDADLPPTQVVVVEEAAGAKGEAAAAADSQTGRQPHEDEPAGDGGDASGAAIAELQLQEGVQQALCRGIQRAAVSLLAGRDLEQLRELLRAVQRLGLCHQWFDATAAVDAAQQHAQGAYGWRLRLSSPQLEMA